jgi:hypothetical protein
MAQRHTPTTEVEMGVEVSSDSATEAARDSIAETKLEVAVQPVSDLGRVVAEQAAEGLRS